jgi:hypothetical protein
MESVGESISYLVRHFVLYVFFAGTNLPTLCAMLGLGIFCRKFWYVVAAAALVALVMSVFLYFSSPGLTELDRSPLVQFITYFVRFIAALIIGVCAFAVAELWRRRRPPVGRQ